MKIIYTPFMPRPAFEKKGSWESSSHWKKGLIPTLKSMTVWWKHTLDQTQGPQSQSFLSLLCLVLSPAFLTLVCVTPVRRHTSARGGLCWWPLRGVLGNLVPSRPCPGKAALSVVKVMFNPGGSKPNPGPCAQLEHKLCPWQLRSNLLGWKPPIPLGGTMWSSAAQK